MPDTPFAKVLAALLASSTLLALTGCGSEGSTYGEEQLQLRWPDASDKRPGQLPKLSLNIPYVLLGADGGPPPGPAPLEATSTVMLFLATPTDAATAGRSRSSAANHRQTGDALPARLSYGFTATAEWAAHEQSSVPADAAQEHGLSFDGKARYVSPVGTPLGEFTSLRCSTAYCTMEFAWAGYQVSVSNFKREWLPNWRSIRGYVANSLSSLQAK